MVIAVADGAGSSERSDVGSRIACDTVIDEVARTMRHRSHVGRIAEDEVDRWILAVQGKIGHRALLEERPVKDYRSTLLVAVVGRREALYAQIGDGAIVVSHGGADASETSYAPIFWPDSGEYANATYFVTDPESLGRLRIRVDDSAPDEVAVLSDGLQMLALTYSDRSAHSPFFRGMFDTVRKASARTASSLAPALDAYLSSPGITQRTDDDKTLVLASRMRRLRRTPIRARD